MIVRLEGRLVEKAPAYAVVDCGGVGYRVSISVTTMDALPNVGEHAVLHTHLIVREDGMELVGFATPSERDAFLMLIGIPGVGVRTALSILSALSVVELQQAVLTNNTALLQQIPGVGRKTAERLVLELREKIGSIAVAAPAGDGAPSALLSEALSALLVLGYNHQRAESSLRQAFDQLRTEGAQITIEQLVKRALRLIHTTERSR